MIIFLGAGASQSLGIPTMKEFMSETMIDELEGFISNKGELNFFSRLMSEKTIDAAMRSLSKEKLDFFEEIYGILKEKYKNELDLEHVLSVIDDLSNPERFLKQTNPTMIYHLKRMEDKYKLNIFELIEE